MSNKYFVRGAAVQGKHAVVDLGPLPEEPLTWPQICPALLDFNRRTGRCLSKEQFLDQTGLAWDAFEKVFK